MKLKIFIPALFIALSVPSFAQDEDFEYEAVAFRTPSGNIHCLFTGPLDEATDQPLVQCEMKSMINVSPMPPPEDCDLDYGKRFALPARGKPGLACHGDTLVDNTAAILPYGEEMTVDGITCKSATKGLTCRNRDGRGFFLSKRKQRLF